MIAFITFIRYIQALHFLCYLEHPTNLFLYPSLRIHSLFYPKFRMVHFPSPVCLPSRFKSEYLVKSEGTYHCIAILYRSSSSRAWSACNLRHFSRSSHFTQHTSVANPTMHSHSQLRGSTELTESWPSFFASDDLIFSVLTLSRGSSSSESLLRLAGGCRFRLAPVVPASKLPISGEQPRFPYDAGIRLSLEVNVIIDF